VCPKFVLKIEKLSHILGTAPILEMARALMISVPWEIYPKQAEKRQQFRKIWILGIFVNRLTAVTPATGRDER